MTVMKLGAQSSPTIDEFKKFLNKHIAWKIYNSRGNYKIKKIYGKISTIIFKKGKIW
jgi:hypothetical protein